MNLVAKEFVSARDDEHGVLVLSQFTGAARELPEALVVNPYDLEEASSALDAALRMSSDEQRDRMRAMRAFLAEFNVYRWAGGMLVDAARLRRKAIVLGRLSGRSGAPNEAFTMKNILGRGALAALRQAANRRVLIGFDFDGTLAPIVRNPDAAAMRPRTAEWLAKVAALYPCVVISGRARPDVMKNVGRLPLRAVLGNHGMEPWRGLPAAKKLVSRWQAELAALLPPIPGLVVEDKGPSLAIHYRRARSRALLHQLILDAVSRLRGARILGGKMVVNVVPSHAPHKGTALLRLCKRLRCDSAIFVGDDDTDEDAFALPKRERVLGIRVGRSRRSQAAYFVSGQAAVDHLLVKLAEARNMLEPTAPARPSTGSRPPAKHRRDADGGGDPPLCYHRGRFPEPWSLRQSGTAFAPPIPPPRRRQPVRRHSSPDGTNECCQCPGLVRNLGIPRWAPTRSSIPRQIRCPVHLDSPLLGLDY